MEIWHIPETLEHILSKRKRNLNKKITMKDKSFILQKRIVIPKGTRFDNYTNRAKKEGYFEAVIGIGKDCVEFFRIKGMEEIIQHEPSFFKEEIVNSKK